MHPAKPAMSSSNDEIGIDDRSLVTTSDLWSCSRELATALALSEAPPLAGVMASLAIARCIVNLTGDALLPAFENQKLHEATEMVSFWGLLASSSTLLSINAMDTNAPDKAVANAKIANFLYDNLSLSFEKQSPRELAFSTGLIYATNRDVVREILNRLKLLAPKSSGEELGEPGRGGGEGVRGADALDYAVEGGRVNESRMSFDDALGDLGPDANANEFTRPGMGEIEESNHEATSGSDGADDNVN